MQLKILLIKPTWYRESTVYSSLKFFKFSPLSLQIIAALSSEHEVTIVDEDWDDIPYDKEFDLVGITSTTFTSEQAYEISERFRNRGVSTVIGGIHAGFMPEECSKYFDAVAIGEAELIWGDILDDMKKGTLKQYYKASRSADLADSPIPDRNVYKEKGHIACVQFSRGCNRSCDFCYLPETCMHQFRKRKISDIRKELSQIKKETIFIVDDNLFVDRDYAIEVFDLLKEYGKRWSIQAPVKIAKDKKLLRKMRETGCYNVLLGFQSINQRSLDKACVNQKVKSYKRTVRSFQWFGISVCGFFIFGFDTDDVDVFETTVKAIKEIQIDDAFLYILTPYPGTSFFDKLKKEGRLLQEKIGRHNFGWENAVFKPLKMTPDQLEEGVRYAREQLKGYFRERALIWYSPK